MSSDRDMSFSFLNNTVSSIKASSDSASLFSIQEIGAAQVFLNYSDLMIKNCLLN